MNQFDIITPEQIQNGEATDAYFERTEEALKYAGKNPNVVAEITADQFAEGEFEIFSGLKDAAQLLEKDGLTVDAVPEGTAFNGGPVMRIEGNYLDFARWETSLLGFLSHASGMATAALECSRAAVDPENGEKTPVLSFGSRHVHPSLGAMVERSALIGGVSGFSNVAAGDILTQEATGTMPHALMLSFGEGNQEEAWKAFDEGVSEDIPRIVLADTFNDEIDEVMRAVDELGERLDGVRLDTTGSRRGDFKHIVREVNFKLKECGRSDVDVFVSGGIGPDNIRKMRDVVDGFGVGGYIVDADTVDFSLDIVEIEGEKISKRGKLSGVKEVYRVDGQHVVVPKETDVDAEPLLQPLIEDGECVREFSIEKSASCAWTDAERVGFE